MYYWIYPIYPIIYILFNFSCKKSDNTFMIKKSSTYVESFVKSCYVSVKGKPNW
jgi:hypothetical protein